MNLHALLIGIDHYEPNDYVKSLKGAVADVTAMERFLHELGVPPQQICKLTASNPISGSPPEPRETWPTYEKMVTSIRGLKQRALNDEAKQVLICYSGHGGRTSPSLLPDLKSRKGYDEGLIPPDIGDQDARYLRDVELAYLVNETVAAGLFVTLIIDACHAGSILRGKLVPRGSRQIDATQRPLRSRVATPEQLEATWKRLHNRVYVARSDLRSAWAPAARGSVLLAACRAVESAHEFPVGGRYRGVLTYCLLDILSEGSSDVSFQEIHNRLIGRVRAYAKEQTPVLEGEVSRFFLGDRVLRPTVGINVLEVGSQPDRVLLGAGQAMGIQEGALLEVVPTVDASSRKTTSRVVEVTAIGAVTASAAAIEGNIETLDVRPGDQAILIHPGERFRRKLAVVQPTIAGTPPAPAGATRDGRPRMVTAAPVFRDGSPAADRAVSATDVSAALRQALEERADRFLALTDEPEAAHFQISVSPRNGYEIRQAAQGSGDARGSLLAVARTPPRAIGKAIRLARFHNVLELENLDLKAPEISVELGWLEKGFTPGDDIRPQPFEPTGSKPTVNTGQWICLTIHNHEAGRLQACVLDLQPGWSIEKIHPKSGLQTLEGGQGVRLPFEIYLPPGVPGGHEMLKVFVTAEPADFGSLELPHIDSPPPEIDSALEGAAEILDRLGAGVEDGTRASSGESDPNAGGRWATAQVEFEVVAPQEL